MQQGENGAPNAMTFMPVASPRLRKLKVVNYLTVAVMCIVLSGCVRSRPRVVLYCAQDKEFAEQILQQFTEQTGLAVDVKYDTEADKSVSLYAELINEKNRPRCDVHWNNEILSTIRLERQGLLEPYASPSGRPYPVNAKAPNHTWHAFAARARVLLINTNLVPEGEQPRSIVDLVRPVWKNRVAMAKPQFGTTATQAACFFEVMGRERTRRFFLDLRANGVQIVAGNKQVAEGVSQGRFAVGMTDTDDAIIEVLAGRPVRIIFPDKDRPKNDRMGTLYIPNTVAMIRGCPNPDGARKLIDYLLGEAVERSLAESASHQIPLNPEVHAQLPAQIERPQIAKPMEVDFGKAADLWDEVQEYLRNEFARPRRKPPGESN